uniref:Uncharacterized protein n=1 Tax=Molossus molossus TaxID=27622 RepID=A0A7J8EEY2_MOLMO|nr:hypothetical protein HJG59_008887 [Molossus molossus]
MRENIDEREHGQADSCMPHTGNQAHNLGMCPDRELNCRPLVSWVDVQPPSHTSWALSSLSYDNLISPNLKETLCLIEPFSGLLLSGLEMNLVQFPHFLIFLQLYFLSQTPIFLDSRQSPKHSEVLIFLALSQEFSRRETTISGQKPAPSF